MATGSNVAVLPVRPARPTIEIGGTRKAALEAAMLSMEIADCVDGMARCELEFGNWGGSDSAGFQHFDRKTIEFGKDIKVKLSDDTLFEGRIAAVTASYPDGGPPKIGLLAEDRLQDLRMTRRTRTFAQSSLADAVRSIASDHSLTPQVNLSGSKVPLLAQLNQSDLAFLYDLARREDAQIWVEGKTLHAAATRSNTRVELRWAGSLREFHVEADLAHQRTAIVAAGWNVGDKKTASHRADDAAVRAELGSTESGGAILANAFGSRVDTVAHELPRDGNEARFYAEAQFRCAARRFVRGRGVAETRADLRVGGTLALTGLGPLFDGDYRVTALAHRFDAEQGMRTEFSCERPGLGRP